MLSFFHPCFQDSLKLLHSTYLQRCKSRFAHALSFACAFSACLPTDALLRVVNDVMDAKINIGFLLPRLKRRCRAYARSVSLARAYKHHLHRKRVAATQRGPRQRATTPPARALSNSHSHAEISRHVRRAYNPCGIFHKIVLQKTV